jgi:VWFA-related protein
LVRESDSLYICYISVVVLGVQFRRPPRLGHNDTRSQIRVTIERSCAYAWVIAITCAAGVSAQTQQDPAPRFSADVNRVLIDVAVSDSSGHAVNSLTAADFRVFDNDLVQTITSADYIRPGVRLSLTNPSKASPQLPQSSGSPVSPPALQNDDSARRVHFHTVVIDDLNIAANHIASIRDGMTALIDRHLAPDDYFAIVQTGRDPKDWCDFTNDRARLRATISKITWNPASSQQLGNAEPTYSDFLEERHGGRELANQVQEHGAARAYRGSFQVLYEVITRLRQIPGRRSFVILSYSLPQSGKLAGLIEYANRNWVSVSTISSRGVDSTDLTAQDKTNNAGRMDPAVLRAGLAARADETGLFTTSLEVLAHGTGGTASVSNDLSDALTQALDNSQGYYLVSFARSAPGGSGNDTHKIVVKVRPRGVTVRTRSSFYAFPNSIN